MSNAVWHIILHPDVQRQDPSVHAQNMDYLMFESMIMENMLNAFIPSFSETHKFFFVIFFALFEVCLGQIARITGRQRRNRRKGMMD